MSLEDDKLLTLCPRCKYRLRGLPIEHVCPECGLEFDRRWKILAGSTSSFHDTRSGKYARGLTIAMASFPACLALGFALFLPVGVTDLPMIVLCLLCSGMIVWFLYGNRRRFVAIGPQGLVIYQREGMSRYDLTEVGRARYKMISKCVEIDIGGNTISLSERAFFPGTVFEAEACVRAINRYPRGSQVSDA